MIHFWRWLLNFTGVNNGQNGFATHMYNFWSGFGGGLIQFSLLGLLAAMYRHYVVQNKVVRFVRDKAPLLHEHHEHHDHDQQQTSKDDDK